MFLLPYAVDVPFDRKPFVNWLLVGSVIAAFAAEMMVLSNGQPESIETFVLNGWRIEGLLGHMWLHADIFHLAGNMLFLWVFGNAVCAKVGNLKYLPIYLFLGMIAAVSFLLFTGGSAVGASGAINGIVGMFLVFFWQNEMDCLFVLILFFRPIVKTFSIASYWMILMWLVFDIAGVLRGGGTVAYIAHLGGFAGGVLLAIALLKLKWVTMYRDEESRVCLFDRWRLDRQDARLTRIARKEIDKASQQHATDSAPAIAITETPARAAELPPKASRASVIRFQCSCGKQMKVAGKYAGRKGRCPHCGQIITVPSSAGVH